MEKLLEEDPNAIESVDVEPGWLVLTSSTKEIQAFVLKYADDKRLFGDEVKLIRTEIDYKAKIQEATEAEENKSKK